MHYMGSEVGRGILTGPGSRDIWESGLYKCSWHPLSETVTSQLLRPQALLTPVFPVLLSIIKSSEQRHFCKSITKGQETETPGSNHSLTEKDSEIENQLSLHSSSQLMD